MKKSIQLFAIILFMLACAGCKKYEDMDQKLYGDGYIRGRVYLADSFLSENPIQVGAGVQIFLGTEPEGENYIISQATDANGYFVFKDLNKGTDKEKKSYYIFTSYKKDSVVYTARVLVTPDTTNFFLVLQPDTQRQNAVVFVVSDSLGNRIAGCHVCVFSNLSNVPDTGCSGSFLTDSSNLNGEVRLLNLPSGTYKVNFSYYSGTSLWHNQVQLTVSGNGIAYKPVTIAPSPLPVINKVSYILLDSLGGTIPAASICAFSSFVLANDSCVGSNWQTMSDSTGKAVIQNIAPGNYKVFFRADNGTAVLKAVDTIWNLGTATQYADTVILQ